MRVKKYILIPVTFIIANITLFAQNSDSAVNKKITKKSTDDAIKLVTPVIEKVFVGVAQYKFKETLHDFGTIKQNQTVSRVFEFINTGTDRIKIESVETSCNCTTPEWTKEPIEVGKTGTVVATFNSSSAGNFSKSITIKFSNGETQYLTIKGFVETEPYVPPAPENLQNDMQN